MRRSIILLTLLVALYVQCSYYSKDPFEKIAPAGQIEMPILFSDHMVLQQNQAVPVWGTATPGTKVMVQIAKQKIQTVVDQNGNWQAKLAPMKVATGLTLQIIGKDTLHIQDVAVGEVWVCSGQSNMEWIVNNTMNAELEVAEANYPKMRLFTVEKAMAYSPMSAVHSTGWDVCTPQTVGTFSAVGYFFGRELIRNLDVPVGLIHTSWGGTPAEAWTSGDALKKMDDFRSVVEKIEADAKTKPQPEQSSQDQVKEWIQALNDNDQGFEPDGRSWKDPDWDDSAWPEMKLPTLWESGGLPAYDGIVWFRKTVTLPESWEGQPLQMLLGPIDDVDTTWVNGALIGTRNVYNVPRVYSVPGSLTESGILQISVRVLDTGGGGGLYGTEEQLKLLNSTGDSLSLVGVWKYQIGVSEEIVPPLPNQNLPTVLYNAMLAPLIPYGIRGAIWYQGESNAGLAYQYRTLFPTMIEDWRSRWGCGEFPFLFVQLANYGSHSAKPRDNDWAELREAQVMTLALPNTGMAVTIDIGTAGDIHPRNKQDVGKRLGLNARALVYGENVPYSGPMYQSMSVEGSTIRLTFDHVYDGLTFKGETLKGFAIAGENRHFVWADAVIENDTIVVSSPEVSEPVAVRYGWDADPQCNLFNKTGLPASPFRTDSWPGITQPISVR